MAQFDTEHTDTEFKINIILISDARDFKHKKQYSKF